MRKTKTGSQFLLFGEGSNPSWSLKKHFPFVACLKSVVPFFLVLLLLAAPAAVQAQFICTTNADNTITITGSTGLSGAVVIPSTINSLPVTGIGDGAFDGAGLASVEIPTSVTNIGEAPFVFCLSLTQIIVDTPNSYYSSANGVLFDASQATLLEYPGGLGGSYTIPDTVTSIGDEAFDFCTSLTGVAIPAGVTNIGDGAFEGCFSLTGIAIPAGVITIGDYAFQFSGLTSITFPGGVTSIGNSAFYECMSLTNVTIPVSVTNIGVAAFDSCASLASFIIPAGVTNIGDTAFASCASLASIYCAGNIPAIGSDVFDEDSVTIYYLPGATGWDNPPDGFPDVVLWNPQIQAGDANFGVQNNQFGFDITSPASLTVEVEACSDLSSPVWIPLQTLTLTNGSAYFSEPLQINSAGLFYALGFP
jgi:hypothetical protein